MRVFIPCELKHNRTLCVQSFEQSDLCINRWLMIMGKKVTIVLENHVDERLHKIQADFIREYKEPISFSKVLNEILHKGLL